MTAHDHVEHPVVLIAELVLVQLAQPHARLQHHIARGGLEVAAQHLHQCGFAAAVGADETIAVAIVEFDRHLLEQRLRAELDGDIGSLQHLPITSGPRPLGRTRWIQ